MNLLTKRQELLERVNRLQVTHKGVYFDEIRPIELKAFRYLREERLNTLASKLGVSMDELSEIENSKKQFVSEQVAKRYFAALGISKSEYGRLKAITNGESKEYTPNRSIPTVIKKAVYKRDSGKCTNCGSNEKIHMHHIKHYSKGGSHSLENIILLCSDCHIEAHKKDWFYHNLKKIFK